MLCCSSFCEFCNSVCVLVSCLMESFDVFMSFPGEKDALTFFDGMSVLLCCTTHLKMTFKPF